jgi:hypothetical protein
MQTEALANLYQDYAHQDKKETQKTPNRQPWLPLFPRFSASQSLDYKAGLASSNISVDHRRFNATLGSGAVPGVLEAFRHAIA